MPSCIDADRQRAIFSKNLNHYMERTGKTTKDLSRDLSYPFSTVSDWVHGKKYPRMDKVQAIADYFGILKSNLTEENQYSLSENAFQLNPIFLDETGISLEKPNRMLEKENSPSADESELGVADQEIMDLVGQLSLEQKDFLIALLNTIVARNPDMSVSDRELIVEPIPEFEHHDLAP